MTRIVRLIDVFCHRAAAEALRMKTEVSICHENKAVVEAYPEPR